MTMPNHAARIAALTAGVLGALTLAHHRPWEGVPAARAAEQLDVGFLPVTCHLTCPVTEYATRSTTTGTRFTSRRFTEFATVIEAMKARKLDATFMLAPLAMVLREQRVPVKIVYLGHRDGSTVMVRKDSTARSLRDLRGKTFARPSRYSNQYLVITKLMDDEGMQPADIRFVDMAPPDMPGRARRRLESTPTSSASRTPRRPSSPAWAACSTTRRTSGRGSCRACSSCARS